MGSTDQSSELAALSAALGAAIEGLGTPQFVDRFCEALEHMIASDMCSAFTVDPAGEVHHLFATGQQSGKRPFLEGHQQTQSRHELRRIVASQRLRADTKENISVVSTGRPLSQVPVYRQWWYAKPRVIERMTILRKQRSHVVVLSLYRIAPSRSFSPDEISQIATAASVVIGLVAKHAQLARSDGSGAPLRHQPEKLAQKLSAEFGLSAREAQLCAWLLLFHSLPEISQATGLSMNTVVTYRRRAYRKLGISSRRELFEHFESRDASSR